MQTTRPRPPHDLRGLDPAEAARRLSRDGPNLLPGAAPRTFPAIVAGVLVEPMFLMLLVAGGLYPALAFVLYLAVYGEWRRVAEMMLPLGAAIAAAIVAPWYVALYLQHGWDPIVSFVLGENLERYTSGYGVHQDR